MNWRALLTAWCCEPPVAGRGDGDGTRVLGRGDRDGDVSRAAPDRTRVRHRARERVSLDDVRPRVARAVPVADAAHTQGAYLPNYYGVGHQSNDDYIAMVSGQAPSAQKQADCQIYDNLLPGTLGSYGQAEGTGCIYPSNVETIGDQLVASGLTWRDYNQSMGADPSREASKCGHPGVGAFDNTQKATTTDSYATRHDPFVYFHSIIDDTALCDSHVVNLDLLSRDLASAATTPNYVFITPDLCLGAVLLSPCLAPTTTTRCSAASRTFSDCRTWATPACRARPHSARMCSPSPARARADRRQGRRR
jgi:Phosphoesterase family